MELDGTVIMSNGQGERRSERPSQPNGVCRAGPTA